MTHSLAVWLFGLAVGLAVGFALGIYTYALWQRPDAGNDAGE